MEQMRDVIKVVDSDAYACDMDDLIKPYLPEPFRSRTPGFMPREVYDRNLGGTLGHRASSDQVISNTGFESPCWTKGKSCRFSPLETPSALCPPQEAGFTFILYMLAYDLPPAKRGLVFGDYIIYTGVNISRGLRRVLCPHQD
jgi:hypothetical protein